MKLTMSCEVSRLLSTRIDTVLEYTHTCIFNLDLFCFTKIGKVRGVGANRSLDAAEFGIAFNGPSVCLSEQRWQKPMCGRRNARQRSFA